MTRFSQGFIYPKRINGALALTWKASTNLNNTAVATFTFATQQIGAAAPDRWVFVLFHAKNNILRNLSSATIGGVAATIEVPDGTLTQNDGMVSIMFANVPTGTTADVVFNWDGAFTAATADGMGIDVYTVIGALNTTAADSLDSNVSTSPISKTFTVPKGGVVFAVATSNNATAAVSGGMTVDRSAVSFVAGSAGWALSAANADNVNSANVSETFTGFSASSALVPIMGRAYGHL